MDPDELGASLATQCFRQAQIPIDASLGIDGEICLVGRIQMPHTSSSNVRIVQALKFGEFAVARIDHFKSRLTPTAHACFARPLVRFPAVPGLKAMALPWDTSLV